MWAWGLNTAERLITHALTISTREWRILRTDNLSITSIVIIQNCKLDWLTFTVLTLEWSLHWALVKRFTSTPRGTTGVIRAQDFVLSTNSLVRALFNISNTGVVWALDGFHSSTKSDLGAVFLLFDTNGFFGGLVESTFDWKVDAAAIGEGFLGVLFLTSEIVFGALTVLVTFLRSMVRATIDSSAHGLILDAHSTFTSVVELRWAGIGDWAVFGIDSARAIITSVEVLFALVKWSTLFR